MRLYYNQFFEKGQQVINFNLYKIGLSADDPVYTLINVLEELDFSSLLARYSDKGRKGYNPIMLFAVLLYANMRGIRAVDRIVELCERDIAFIWLTKGEKPQRDAFYSFLNDKLSKEVLEDLHYQFIRILEKEGLVTLKSLFIDGTKIEANANRYTFVWRGTLNYHLAGLLDNIDELYSKYNKFIESNGYNEKYEFPLETMFVIDKIDKIKNTIGENRKRKSLNLKKLSNNSIIEIDNISPIELLKLQIKLFHIASAEKIPFVYGKGQRKSEIQKLYEAFEEASIRLFKYKNHFKVMGNERNSYSKTDVEATFMRMKDDHIQNGRSLEHQYFETRTIDGYKRKYEVYSCNDCSGCEFKSKCLYKYNEETDINKNKAMKINMLWESLKSESHENVQSEKGITYRHIRSIQTEVHFGDIKENKNFRRFNYRTSDKVYKEFLLYAVGRNLNKYHRFANKKIKKYERKIA